MNKNKATNKGFTLIEILIVIGIIGILAAVVLVAINPARQFAQARESQRVSNVNAILNAIGQRIADNKGTFAGTVGSLTCPSLTTASSSVMSGTGSAPATWPAPATATLVGAAAPAPALDLSCLTPTYIPAFPSDPAISTGNYTGYEVSVGTNGRVMVCAPASLAETAIPTVSSLCISR